MDAGFLTTIILTFREALFPLAPKLAELVGPSWYTLSKLSFLLLIMSVLAGATPSVIRGLLIGTLVLGFTHILIDRGYVWTESLFRGTAALSQFVGLPSPDPSSLVRNGMTVAAPVFKALEDQSTLWVITSPLQHLSFTAAAWGVSAAFYVLALLQLGYLLMSFTLYAAAPVFCLFAAVPLLNQLTQRWFSLVISTMAGLIALQVLSLGMENIGEAFAGQLETTFKPGTTHTLAEYMVPGAIGWLLTFVFAWVPLRFSREAGGVAGDLFSSVSAVAWSAVSAAGRVGRSTGGQSDGGGTGGGGGSVRETMGTGGTGNSGGSMGPAQARGNQWGPRP